MAPSSSRSSKTVLRSITSAESTVPVQSPAIRAPRRSSNGVLGTGNSTKPLGNLPSKLVGGLNGSLRSAKVDTNPRSYDRRDPFNAFNTLIKLLSSLSSRFIAGGGGGCHYKLLNIDEHKLCMHLCNIVEPFLLSSLVHEDDNSDSANPNALFKPRVLLTRQPTEILDRIAFFVEARGDLMSFGLTCKRLCEVVFPRHWEYRVIRAKVSMTGVWKHLYERADLAANVRIIEVVDERSNKRVLVPKVCRKAAAVKQNEGFTNGMEVISATSTEEDPSSASASEGGSLIASKVSIHKRQEKYFTAALARASGLLRLTWEANHSPMSVIGDGTVWRTLMEKCGESLQVLEVVDNMAFTPHLLGSSEDDEHTGRAVLSAKSALTNLRSLSLQATPFKYGAPKEPGLSRIEAILHKCPNIEHLEIIFRQPRAVSTSLPIANDLFVGASLSHLTSLTLSNISCFSTTVIEFDVATQVNPLVTFLCEHSNLEKLKILNVGPSSQFRRLRNLRRNMLPKLRELHANRDIVSMVLRAECDERRPLETITGFKLVGAPVSASDILAEREAGAESPNTNVNLEFYKNLKKVGGSVKRIELEGWNDLDDIKMLAWSVPGLVWLDVGRRLRPASGNPFSGAHNPTRGQAQGPVTNMVEWAEVLSGIGELTTFHGVKFFYEISPNALLGCGTSATANDISTGGTNVTPPASNNNTAMISMTERSRIKKNDEIAGVLAWKCVKLRRVDHWEGPPGATGKVINLFRDSDFGPGVEGKVRWDVRRIRQ